MSNNEIQRQIPCIFRSWPHLYSYLIVTEKYNLIIMIAATSCIASICDYRKWSQILPNFRSVALVVLVCELESDYARLIKSRFEIGVSFRVVTAWSASVRWREIRECGHCDNNWQQRERRDARLRGFGSSDCRRRCHRRRQIWERQWTSGCEFEVTIRWQHVRWSIEEIMPLGTALLTRYVINVSQIRMDSDQSNVNENMIDFSSATFKYIIRTINLTKVRLTSIEDV